MQGMFAIIVMVLAALVSPARAMPIGQAARPALSSTDQPAPRVTSPDQTMATIAAMDRAHHDRLFIALFDCSWKNTSKGPSEPTTVRRIYLQWQQKEKEDPHLHAEYVATDCARDNWFASPDHGRSVMDARLEQMYQKLGAQSARWLGQDPQARITLLNLGGSWGAVQAAEFAVVVAHRGIRDSDDGADSHVVTNETLIAPGQTAQAIALLDPVGAADSALHLPSTVISGIQFTALDEHRPAFQSVQIIGKGISADGRFIGLFVPGAHSDVCGGYHRDGLAIRTANVLIDYINGLGETPWLTKQFEPDDPRLNVIHHSEEEGT